jgi:acyl-CoA synthetase (NDP forming)
MPLDPRTKAEEIFRGVRAEGRRELMEHEAKGVLEAYGFSVNPTRLARSRQEALELARGMGYPVNVKICSPDILHKSDAGAVRVGLSSDRELERAFEEVMANARAYRPGARILGATLSRYVPQGTEVIIGGMKDPTFGPVVMFGLGGIWVEVLKDVSFRLAPLERVDAEEMIREIRGFPVLQGLRGKPKADLGALVDMLLKAGRLLSDFPEIAEMDINPIFVFEEGKGARAVDARIILS